MIRSLSADAVDRAVQESRSTAAYRRFAGRRGRREFATSDVHHGGDRAHRSVSPAGTHRTPPLPHAGDTVAILESMKMEMPVEAEDEGTVTKILVEEGQAVSEGDPLVELG